MPTCQFVLAIEPSEDLLPLSPQPPPSGLQDLRRVSVQPPEQSIESCLEWSTVDFFVDEDGLVVAITVDLWEP